MLTDRQNDVHTDTSHSILEILFIYIFIMNSYTKYNNFMQNYFFVCFTSRRSNVNNRPEIQKGQQKVNYIPKVTDDK